MLRLEQKQVIATMEKLDFFREFTPEEKEQLAVLPSHLVTFKRGAGIIKQGATDSVLYLILKGIVRITRDEDPGIVITRLQTGSVFGEIGFITKRPRTTNASAQDDVLAFRIDGDLFGKVSFVIQNKIKDKILQILIQRIDQMNNSLMEQIR